MKAAQQAASRRRCRVLWYVAVCAQLPLWWFIVSSLMDDRTESAADCPGRIPSDVRIAPFHGNMLPAQWRDHGANYDSLNATHIPIRRSFILTSFTSAVPEPLHANVQALLDVQSEFVLEYFTLAAARTYMHRESSQRFADAFDRMSNINDKLAYFALVYIRARGGIVIDPRLGAFRTSPTLDTSTRYVLLLDDTTKLVSTTMFGGAAGDEGLIAAIVEAATKRALAPQRHASALVVTSDLIEEVFRTFEGFPLKSRMRTRTGVLLGLSRKPQCYTAYITDADARRVGHFGCGMLCQAGYTKWLETSSFVVPEPSSGKHFCNVRSDLTLETVPISTVPRLATENPAASKLSTIPKVMLHLVPRTRVPRAVSRAVSTQVDHHPELEHRVMDLHYMKEYVKRFPRVKAAFESLAYSADRMQLFMLAYLAENGGVVLPTTALLEGPVSGLYDPDSDLVLAAERKPQTANDTIVPARWLIGAAPQNPVLTAALNTALRRIFTRQFASDSDHVVGPSVIVQAFHQAGAAARNRTRWLKLLPPGVCESPRVEAGSEHAFMHLAYRYAASDAWFFDNNEAAHTDVYVHADVGLVTTSCPFGLKKGGAVVALDTMTNPITVDAVPFRGVLDSAYSSHVIRVPRVIIQAERHLTVPRGLQQAMQTVMDHNPDFAYRYFDLSMMNTFVTTRCDAKAVRAYRAAAPFELKLEVFKYCYLVLEGGVFIDAAITALAPVSSLLTPSVDFLAAEDNNERTIYTGFIATVPGHAVLRRALSLASDRILTRQFTQVNSLAGSVVLGESFSAVVGHPPVADLLIGSTRLVQHARLDDCTIGVIRLSAPQAGGVQTPSSPVFYTGYRDEAVERAWFTAGELPVGKQLENRSSVDGPSGCPVGVSTLDPSFATRYDSHDDDAPLVLVDVAARQPATRRGTKSLRIPRHVLQMSPFDKVPKVLRDAMTTVHELNQDFTQYHYSDERITHFMHSHFDRRVVTAFDSLASAVMRRELFRYCWLYRFGGVYISNDVSAVLPLEDLLTASDASSPFELIVVEDSGTGLLDDSIIATIAKHPFMERVLNMSLTRILNQEYGTNASSITGALLLTDSFIDHVGARPDSRKAYPNSLLVAAHSSKAHCEAGSIRDSTSRTVFHTHKFHPRDLKKYEDTDEYFQLWSTRRAFRDPATVCPTTASTTPPAVPLGGVAKLLDVAAHRPATVKGRHDPGRLIPRHIIQIAAADRVPVEWRDAMHSVELWNPEYNIDFFNAQRAANFVLYNCNFTERIPDGLLRRVFVYCYLYIKGGVFVDARHIAISALDEAFFNSTRNTTLYAAVAHQSTKSVLTATDTFIAAPPGHAVVANALRTVLDMAMAFGATSEYGDEAFAAAAGAVGADVTLLKRTNVEGCDMSHVIGPHGRALFWSPKPSITTTHVPSTPTSTTTTVATPPQRSEETDPSVPLV